MAVYRRVPHPAFWRRAVRASAPPAQASHDGQASATLPALTAAAQGASGPVAYDGQIAATLPQFTAAAQGSATQPSYAGQAAGSVPALTGQATAALGYSLRFFGSDPATNPDVDHVRIPLRSGGSPTPVDVGSGDFTYECWLRCVYSDNTSTRTDDWRYSNIFFDRDAWNSPRGHGIGVARSGSNLVVVFGVAGASLNHVSIATTSNIGDDAWHHIAVTRQQSTGVIRIYVDGVEEASGTYTTGTLAYDGSNAGGQNNDQIVLGREKHDVGSGFNGRLDELRISDSRRYTGNFARPVAPFSPDANAVGLYHADEGAGTTLRDWATVSGAPTHGTLFVGGPSSGPQWSSLNPFPAQAIHAGQAAATLPGPTSAASGSATQPSYAGAASGTLPALSAAAQGAATQPSYDAQAAGTLPALTGQAQGSVTQPSYGGQAAAVLPLLTAAAVGSATQPVYAGQAATVLPALTSQMQGASGALGGHDGTAAGTLPALTSAAAGSVTLPSYAGQAAASLPALSAAAQGSVTRPSYAGQASGALPALTGQAQGASSAAGGHDGQAAGALPPLTAQAQGAVSLPSYAGQAAASLPGLSGAASGGCTQPSYDGQAVAALPVLIATASGAMQVSHAGQAIGTLPGLTASGLGAMAFNDVVPRSGGQVRGPGNGTVRSPVVAGEIR